MTRPVPSVRTVAAAVAVVGAVIFVTLAVVLVPWHPVPGGGPPTLPAPDTVLSPEQLARAEAYAGPARWLGWSSLLVSLVVVCWLGFTEAGARLVGRLRGWWWVRVVLGVALCMVYFGYFNFLDGFKSLRMPSMTPLSSLYAAIPLCGALVAIFIVEQMANGWKHGFAGASDADEKRKSL